MGARGRPVGGAQEAHPRELRLRDAGQEAARADGGGRDHAGGGQGALPRGEDARGVGQALQGEDAGDQEGDRPAGSETVIIEDKD